MRVLVVTVVHDPRDARISARQIPALLAAGHEVTFAAPFGDTNVDPTVLAPAQTRDLPRAVGRRRLDALRAARQVIRRESAHHDLVLLHDPELLLVAAPSLLPTVWDVHEDAPAAVLERPYLSPAVRRASARALRRLEQRAETRMHLILAEQGYASRFASAHPVVPNAPVVGSLPDVPRQRRAVYLGRVSLLRGLGEMIAVARRAPDIRTDIVGWADQEVEELLHDAPDNVHWTGRDHVPNQRALAYLPGASVGFSLLHDSPNYRVSLPTKVLEYMAHGVPVVTTPLPQAAAIVEEADCGYVVPFGDVGAMTRAVRRLADDPAHASAMGARGWQLVKNRYDWSNEGVRFVQLLENWARA